MPWTLLGISKSLLTLALAALPLIDLVWLLWYREEEHEVSPATFVADAVRVATYLTCLVLQILCQVWFQNPSTLTYKYIIVPETWSRHLRTSVYLLVYGSFMFHTHLQVKD